jgi:hypothetical protein
MVVSSIPPLRDDLIDPKTGEIMLQWAHLADLTWATQKKYCALHGYAFDGNVSDVWLPLSTPWIDRVPSSQKSAIRMMVKFQLLAKYLDPKRCLEEFDHVVWIDADVVIGDYDTPLEKWMNGHRASDGDGPFVGDVIIPYDVNTLHPTVIMMRASRLTRGLVWSCTEAGDRLYRQHGWSDLMALRFFLSGEPYRSLLWQHSAQVLCAMPPGIHPMPEDVRAMYEWEDGVSWALHLSALPIATRIKLAKAFIEERNLL